MSYVYLITSGKAVKIGITDDTKARLSKLQTAHYEQLRVYCAFQCESKLKASQLEALLHNRYARYRLKGEWFNINPDKIVADTLADEKLRVYIIGYQIHRVGMMEAIANLLSAKLEQAQQKVSNTQERVSGNAQENEFLVALGLTLGGILLILFGGLLSGSMSVDAVYLLITLGFGFAIMFAIALAVELWQRIS